MCFRKMFVLAFLLLLIGVKPSLAKLVWCQHDYLLYSNKPTIYNIPYSSNGYCVRDDDIKFSEKKAASIIQNNKIFRKHLCFLLSGKITENLKPYLELKNNYNINCDTNLNNTLTISEETKNPSNRPLASVSDSTVCYNATTISNGTKVWNDRNKNFVGEANYRGLDCNVRSNNQTIKTYKPKTKTSVTNAELEKAKR